MFDQVTVDKDIYEDVDEETYKEIVRKRREEDFIEDDGTQPPELRAQRESTRGSSKDWPSASRPRPPPLPHRPAPC